MAHGGKFQEPAGAKCSVQVSNEDEGPLISFGMVGIGPVAGIDNERVLHEWCSVGIARLFEAFDEAHNELKMEAAENGVDRLPGSLSGLEVANLMQFQVVNAEPAEVALRRRRRKRWSPRWSAR